MPEIKSTNGHLFEVYKETCTAYHAVDDFRAKLLALLPIASGIGGVALLEKQTALQSHLFYIGLFGLLVALGLFFYELRGISNCGRIINVGTKLEEQLGIKHGVFGGENPIESRVCGVNGVKAASYLVYGSVISGWAYIAYIGWACICG